MVKNRREFIALTTVTTAALVLPITALAAYPDKIVRMVVPFSPGGATDIIGRLLANHLSTELGQSVVVENKAGAGGSIGADAVAKSAADGYSILMGAMTSHSTIATLEKSRVKYDLLKDLTAVAVVGQVPLVFVSNPKLPIKSMKELVAYVNTHPNKVSFGSSGAGAPQRMAAEMLRLQQRLDVEHVPYRGSGPAIADLMGGQLQFMAETVPAVRAHIMSGRLTALAVAASKRDPGLPDVPTTAEAGFPDLEVSSTFGVLVPSGTPAAITQRLNTEIYKILQKPEVRSTLLQQGVAVQAAMSPEAAQERLHAEVAKWAKVIADAKIKADE